MAKQLTCQRPTELSRSTAVCDASASASTRFLYQNNVLSRFLGKHMAGGLLRSSLVRVPDAPPATGFPPQYPGGQEKQ